MKSYFWFMLSNSVLQTSCSRSVGSLQCSSIPLLALCGLFISLKGNYCYRNIYKKGRNKEINWSWSWFCGVKEKKVEKKRVSADKKVHWNSRIQLAFSFGIISSTILFPVQFLWNYRVLSYLIIMREIVHLQAGQCGNQIGAKVKI